MTTVSPGDVREAWTRELDRLEADLRRAELTAADAGSGSADGSGQPWIAWEPPVMPGPIPADLVGRATGLLDRLAETREALSRSLTAVQAQLGLVSVVADIAPAAGERRPVYLDVSC